jgi:ubiquinone/menaquinone biosynthesis C-methylase UbiE
LNEFENPDRDAYQKPKEIISALGLSESSIVVDIGAATGYFPIKFAQFCSKGKVYALDIEESMVNFLKERIQKENIKNIVCMKVRTENKMKQRNLLLLSVCLSLSFFVFLKVNTDDFELPESVDVIFSCNVYHHIENRPHYFRKIGRFLKKEGIVAINDWKEEKDIVPTPDIQRPKGPPPR